MSPAWLLDVFAAAMLVVAAVSAARLAAVPRWRGRAVATDVDVAHLLMAVAMAGMLAAALATLPDTGWEVVFGLMTAWFARQVWRDAGTNGVRALAGARCAPHLVHGGAMLYMLLARGALARGPRTGGMAGTAGSSAAVVQPPGYSILAVAFALALVGCSVWDLDQLSGGRYSLSGAGMPPSPAGVLAVAGSGSAGDAAAISAPAAGDAVPGEPSGSAPGVGALLLSPGTTVSCRIVMGVTMAFMLTSMI